MLKMLVYSIQVTNKLSKLSSKTGLKKGKDHSHPLTNLAGLPGSRVL